MARTTNRPDPDWVCSQIAAYREIKPRYDEYARTLAQVLEQASRRLAPYGVVQTRAKAIASFAEKIQRKWPEVQEPLNDFTDLCGGRVITFTEVEVQAVCQFLRDSFGVDWTNTVLEGQRQKTSEFGYRSEHYIVQLKRGAFPSKDVTVEVPDAVYGLKAEIQVRTFLAHAWAGFTHDRVYKGTFRTPDKWVRELAGVSALLEQADDALCRIEEGLQTYEASYGAYMTNAQMREEIALLQQVLVCDPHNAGVAHRIGKLAMTLGDWPLAVESLASYATEDQPAILRDLGVSLCKIHEKAPSSPEYLRGQRLLEQACDVPDPDPDALASLAGTWRDTDPEKARGFYRRAYEVAPSYPYAVANFLASEIAYRRDTSPVTLMAPAITAAVQRCRDQIAVGMNLPWAYYDLGVFQLVLGRPYESLAAYAKAVQLSAADWVVETSLTSLMRLAVVRGSVAGYEWVHRFLLIALEGKFGNEKHVALLKKPRTQDNAKLTPQVVIVAGSSDSSVQAQMSGYSQLLVDAFCGFKGTVISGGTTAGVGGLVGTLQEKYPELRTVGHIPELIPLHATPDRRYSELRPTPGHDFDPMGPVQVWADIVESGIKPADVKLLGIGGGRIAALEYRMALALGAQVGVLEGSGRSAAQLVGDDEWNDAENLSRLAPQVAALQKFLWQPAED